MWILGNLTAVRGVYAMRDSRFDELGIAIGGPGNDNVGSLEKIDKFHREQAGIFRRVGGRNRLMDDREIFLVRIGYGWVAR
ncbi:MAG: hypothetical protein KatS3mg110_0587 [Pirellulaceae bacterium]|nr:MAG: hypothetical protein KatS3mg110_0587 [Pirellulaceae bacterium]